MFVSINITTLPQSTINFHHNHYPLNITQQAYHLNSHQQNAMEQEGDWIGTNGQVVKVCLPFIFHHFIEPFCSTSSNLPLRILNLPSSFQFPKTRKCLCGCVSGLQLLHSHVSTLFHLSCTCQSPETHLSEGVSGLWLLHFRQYEEHSNKATCFMLHILSYPSIIC